MTLYQVQTNVSLPGAAKHLADMGLPHTLARDPDFAIKTVLTETLNGSMVRPWAVHTVGRDGGAVVVGYAGASPDDLESGRRLALPSLQKAVERLEGFALPELRARQRLAFSIRLCPTVISTRRGETDAFLLAVDDAGDDRPDRETVYADYLARRLQGAQVEACRVDGWKLLKMARKSRKSKSGAAQRTYPEARLSGLLSITEPAQLLDTLAHGIGRQRAFGFGMLRLGPPDNFS